MAWRRWFNRFGAARSGATAVEFALLAPLYFVVMIGTFELGMIAYVNTALEAGARAASRSGFIGNVDADGHATPRTQTEVEDVVRSYLIGPFAYLDTSSPYTKLHVDVKIYGSWTDVPEPSKDRNNNGVIEPGEFTDLNGNSSWDHGPSIGTGPGASNQIVVYRITYSWSPFTPLIGRLLGVGSGGIIPIVAVAAVQNEPWS